jgi:hypothetical protein
MACRPGAGTAAANISVPTPKTSETQKIIAKHSVAIVCATPTSTGLTLLCGVPSRHAESSCLYGASVVVA